ncbi:MAG: hypothetical protein AAGC71_15605 [Pseudomonadota bacterium]
MTFLTWLPARWGAGDEPEPVLQVDDFWAKEVFSAYATSVGEKLEAAGVDVLKERLIEIFDVTKKGQFSTTWRPAVEDHEQNKGADKVPSVLISAFRDALLGFADRRAVAASDYLQGLIGSDIVVLQRVAIFVIGTFRAQFQHLIPQLIDPKWFSYQYQHEMYGLLEVSVADFSDDEIKDLIEVIHERAAERKGADESVEMQEKREAYEALRWLSAGKDRGSKTIDDLYATYRSITGADLEHPSFSSYVDSGWIGDQSPYTVEDLLSREFSEFAKILHSFKESGAWKSPTRRGLALAVKDAVKSRPEYFQGNLMSLIGTHHDYTSQIIDGYRDLWNDCLYDNWRELLEFCHVTLKSDGFWPDGEGVKPEPLLGAHGSVVGSIADLVRTGTASDETAYDGSHLPTTREILVLALEKQESADFSGNRDAVSVAINSPRGKCIEALFNFALRLCRIADAGGDGHKSVWENELRPHFDEQMELLDSGNLEFATLYANYLPNLLFMNWAWTIDGLPTVFSGEDHERWACAMQGYTFVNQVYTDVYTFLRDDGHILKALDSEVIESRGKNKLIQNIAIEYLRGGEQLTDANGLLRAVLDRWQDDELRELIWFIWTLRDGKRQEYLPKVLPLWTEIARRADGDAKNDQRILARLCSLSAFIDELDVKVKNLILRGARYVEREHDSYILVEQLRRLVDEYPNQVADIYLVMLEEFAPTYQKENIEQTLAAIYKSGGVLRQKANQIFDKYVERGVEFVMELRIKLAQENSPAYSLS